MPKTIHQGRNIKRFREMFGIKQDTFADQLGEDWSQKRVSMLEAKEEIDDKVLAQVAAILKIPAEAIKNFDEDAAVNIVANTFHEESSAYVQNYKCTFNPFEKLDEALQEIKWLNTALIKEKDEKIALLEKLLNEKKK